MTLEPSLTVFFHLLEFTI